MPILSADWPSGGSIVEHLVTLDPENVQWQDDLQWLRARLAKLK